MNHSTQAYCRSVSRKVKHITFSERQQIERWLREKKFPCLRLHSPAPFILFELDINFFWRMLHLFLQSTEMSYDKFPLA